MRGPCACPARLLDPQGGQAQGPHSSALPPLVPTTPRLVICVGTRGGGGRMRGPCACPARLLDPQGGQAQGPLPSALPPLVPTTNSIIAQAKTPTHPLSHLLSLRQTQSLLHKMGQIVLLRCCHFVE